MLLSADFYFKGIILFKISVIIPTYKPDNYIFRCLQSIDCQTLSKEEFKVYIALNGPKDSYEEVIDTALENTSFNYELFYLEEAGVSNARNYLIENSNEPFVTFIDDDDCISPIYLESLLRASSVDTIGISNVYDFEHDISERKPDFIGQCFLKLATVERSKFKSRKYFSSPWAKLIHRNIIGSTRFNTKLTMSEDALFMAELSNKVSAVRKASSEAIYYVYERPNSASRKKIKRLDEIERILYLTLQYTKLFFNPRYDRLFIATRIAATLKFVKRIF